MISLLITKMDFEEINEFLQNLNVEGKLNYNQYQTIINKYMDGNDIHELFEKFQLTSIYDTYRKLKIAQIEHEIKKESRLIENKKQISMCEEEIEKLESSLEDAEDIYESRKNHYNRYRVDENDEGNPVLKENMEKALKLVDSIKEEISNWQKQIDEMK